LTDIIGKLLILLLFFAASSPGIVKTRQRPLLQIILYAIWRILFTIAFKYNQ